MLLNMAAWLTAEKVRPLEVREAPYSTPKEIEILVKNHAIAINPIDTYIQALAFFPLKYPAILGLDLVGEVVAVGSNVRRFKQGDRVIGHGHGITCQDYRESAFQSYTIVQQHEASPIPDGML